MEGRLTDPVTEAVRRFEESEQATANSRQLAERDLDYYNGKQWTEAEESALTARGQPVVTYNRIQRKVNFLLGLEAQTRKDPKAFPRTPGDEGSAQAATDALRYVCDAERWDAVRSKAFFNLVTPGTGAVFVGAKRGKQGMDPCLIPIAWDRLYYDPYSAAEDFADAAYMGIVTWLELDDAVKRWPEGASILEETWKKSRSADTYDDRPKNAMWADHKRKRVRVCEEYYLKDGSWHRCVFTQGGYLEEPAPSPYLDEDGQPENPIKAISAYIDRDNNRYGEVRAMISPQDEVNKRRSKGLHLINSRQFRMSPSARTAAGSSNALDIKRELAKPDGYIVGEKDEVEVLQTTDMAAANFQMLQEAKAEIDLLGPNAALAGKNENDMSGRAILAQQQGGMVEVALLMDRLRVLSLAVYRSLWARIKQYWTEQRWIRITDDERNLKWVGLNAPRTMIEVAAERLQGDPQAEMKLQMLAQDPRSRMVMEVQNPVAEMDVDIIMDEGMDTPTVQSEQFELLTKMMPALTQLPPPYAKLMIEASSFRDKDKLLEIVEGMAQQGNPMEAQMQAEQQKLQVQMQMRQAELEQEGQLKAAGMQQDAALQRDKFKLDALLKREGARIDAETEIVKAKIKAGVDAHLGELNAQVAAKQAENRPEAA